MKAELLLQVNAKHEKNRNIKDHDRQLTYEQLDAIERKLVDDEINKRQQ